MGLYGYLSVYIIIYVLAPRFTLSPTANPPSVDSQYFSNIPNMSQDVSFGTINESTRLSSSQKTHQALHQTHQHQRTSSQPASRSAIADYFYRSFSGPPNLPKTINEALFVVIPKTNFKKCPTQHQNPPKNK